MHGQFTRCGYNGKKELYKQRNMWAKGRTIQTNVHLYYNVLFTKVKGKIN